MKRDRIQLKIAAVFLSVSLLLFTQCATVKDTIDARVSVPEEGGIRFLKITDEANEVLTPPKIRQKTDGMEWDGSPLLALSSDNTNIAYLAYKNGQSNIMIRPVSRSGVAVQRTFRPHVNSVAWSPDGKSICFSEYANQRQSIFMTEALQGTILRQISGGNSNDYAPAFAPDGDKVFFAKNEGYDKFSIWSYDFAASQFSNYSLGAHPYPVDEHSFLCTRGNTGGKYEIWQINYTTGQETLILPATDMKSFSSPKLSPDGKWILCVGTTNVNNRVNLDIYVVEINGTNLTQLTYHQGHDMSPVWSKDGKEIYFLSQRGTEKGQWNIWRMNFPL